MATPFSGSVQVIGVTGPVAGALIDTFVSGTLTAQAAYTTAGLSIPHSNPIVCDALGRATVWLNPALTYRIRYRDAAGVAIPYADFDNVRGAETGVLVQLANAASVTEGDALVIVKTTATGSVATTQHEVNEREINTFDFLTAAQKADVIAGNFALDCRAAVQAAVTAAIAGGIKKIKAPGKGYLIAGVASSDTVLNGILIPFSQVNFDPKDQIVFEGDGAGTVFRCGTAGMVAFRVSRNCTVLRDLTIDGNSLANTWGVGIVPESMTQTTTLVSQTMVDLDNVSRVNLTEGIVIMPGPKVAGADSGCFYHNIRDGISNQNTRHVYLKKNVDWATNPNRPTRTNFYGQRLLRGNAGFHFEVGSEINLFGCNEEMIATGVTPLATPTARHISADCTNVYFYGGYSEACTKSAALFANNVKSWGYIPASGSNTDWRTYANAWADGQDDSVAWTPVLGSSGGGTPGASTSTGMSTKNGKIVHFTCQISQVKTGLTAGDLFITGLPFVADTAWTGADFQGVAVVSWAGMTFSANVFTMGARVTGGILYPRKLHAAGGGAAALQVSECATTVLMTIQGWYKVT